jgi:hypothetical protein
MQTHKQQKKKTRSGWGAERFSLAGSNSSRSRYFYAAIVEATHQHWMGQGKKKKVCRQVKGHERETIAVHLAPPQQIAAGQVKLHQLVV